MDRRFPHMKAQRAEDPASHPSPQRRTYEQEWLPCEPLPSAERACCCPAQPVVEVVMPATRTRPRAVELLLCGHHYRASRKALIAAGAIVIDASGALVLPGAWLAAQEPAATDA